jgi:hypothetical protein
VPDLAGDVAFEAADRFELGLAFCLFALDVGAGVGVPGDSAQRDDVDRPVELAVTAAVQAERIVLPELAGIGAVLACRAKHASERNRCAPAVRPMITAAVTVPIERCSSSCGACVWIRAVSSENNSRCSPRSR